MGDEFTLHICDLLPEDRLTLKDAYRYTVADGLRRYLEMKGWRVKTVLNVTNPGNSLFQEEQDGRPGLQDFGMLHNARFIEDLQALNVRAPDYCPRPSEMMPQMPASLQALLAGDAAYDAAGNVCFHMEPGNSDPSFLQLWITAVTPKNQSRKKSASQEKPVMVSDLRQRYTPDDIRLYLAQHHYRRPWSYDEVMLQKAAQYVGKLKAALTAVSSGEQPINVIPALKRFNAALDNDLDTSKGIATLLNLADEILFRAPNGYRVDETQAALQKMASVFGLRLLPNGNDRHHLDGWQKLDRRLVQMKQ